MHYLATRNLAREAIIDAQAARLTPSPGSTPVVRDPRYPALQMAVRR